MHQLVTNNLMLGEIKYTKIVKNLSQMPENNIVLVKLNGDTLKLISAFWGVNIGQCT